MSQSPTDRLSHGAEASTPSPERSAHSRIAESAARIRFAVAQGLAQGRVGFHFQPVVRADRRDFPAFYEMLVRLTLPNGKVLPAGGFLPFVEGGPLGRAIDRLALTRAVELLRSRPELRLAVNMSPLTMGDEGWLETFERAAATAAPALGRLIVEITETDALHDIGQTRDFMDHVRRFGVALALDDFGAGATGFRHFRELRFDIVKIDGAFVRNVATTPDAQVLVECLMAVARHFEMVTVAERVEDEADADWLARLGIDCLQGYLCGRPAEMPAAPSAALPRTLHAVG